MFLVMKLTIKRYKILKTPGDLICSTVWACAYLENSIKHILTNTHLLKLKYY